MKAYDLFSKSCEYYLTKFLVTSIKNITVKLERKMENLMKDFTLLITLIGVIYE